MLATVASATLSGVDGLAVTVEAHVVNGLPSFSVVGLPDTSCREARDRVRAAIVSSGFRWPQRRMTVNLAPSGLRKGGAGLDLPMAVAVLAADGQLPTGCLDDLAFLGELGLDGSVRRIPGVLALVAAVSTPAVVVPAAVTGEAALLDRHRICPATTLRRVVAVLRGEDGWPGYSQPPLGLARDAAPDLADVRGQAVGRLAVEVAAAGGHHLLLVGPPGAGKTMLARRLPGLLPPLELGPAIEVTRIHSAAGVTLPPEILMRRPPFRAPHHSSSMVSLIGGGGATMRPGEVSCATHGVLFLDELGEFSIDVLDTLRQPLEQGEVLVCRARSAATFPARFLLVAAMNPCPCGEGIGPSGCRCTPSARTRYAGRVSGPLLDRFDLRVVIDRPDVGDLLGRGPMSARPAETTATVVRRVTAARRLAAQRGFAANAEIPTERLDELVPLRPAALDLLERRLRGGRLSARGLHRIRRVARTLADLAGVAGPLGVDEVHAALQLRTDPLAIEGAER